MPASLESVFNLEKYVNMWDWYLFNKPSEAGGRARRALARRTASEAR